VVPDCRVHSLFSRFRRQQSQQRLATERRQDPRHQDHDAQENDATHSELSFYAGEERLTAYKLLQCLKMSIYVFTVLEHLTYTNSRASFSFEEGNSTQEFSKDGRVYYWKNTR
jgi:hypothetical protein